MVSWGDSMTTSLTRPPDTDVRTREEKEEDVLLEIFRRLTPGNRLKLYKRAKGLAWKEQQQFWNILKR